MAESETNLRATTTKSDNFNRTDLPWYQEELKEEDLSPDARKLLQEYSGIPAEKVVAHVKDVVSI
jgi:hypothetical protein